jgi:hypothetical protein
VRRLSSHLVLVLLAVALALPGSADAVGTGNPVIESPTASQKLYAGFSGPFTVDLSDAPIGAYSYYVDKDADGSGTPVLVGGKHTYAYNGSFDEPELSVSALQPGTGYAFHITYTDPDMVVHDASYSFSVSSDPPPRCLILLPAQVRMAGRSYLIRASLSPQCKTLHTVYASWQARDPKNYFAETFTFDGVRTDTWRLYDDERTGLYKVRPSQARSSANTAVLQNQTQLTMRMDSRIGLTATRSGRFVTLRTALIRYSPVANKFVVWAKRKVVLSYRNCTTGAWRRLTVRTSSSKGTTSYKVAASVVRQYRATAAGTSTLWAPKPRYVRR